MEKSVLKIYPVIEISPWRIDGGSDIEPKAGQSYTDFAVEIFKKNGINHIEKLDVHGYSGIPIADIDDADLRIIIEKELLDAEIAENGTENVSAFSGGFVIIYQDTAVICYQCCANVANYKEWLAILEEQPKDWAQIWIGHPWIYARVRDGQLKLSDYIEHTGSLSVDLAVKMQVDLAEFSAAFRQAVDELMAFKRRILKILAVEMPDIATAVSELLIENNFEDDFEDDFKV